jgi:hypothetical protein
VFPTTNDIGVQGLLNSVSNMNIFHNDMEGTELCRCLGPWFTPRAINIDDALTGDNPNCRKIILVNGICIGFHGEGYPWNDDSSIVFCARYKNDAPPTFYMIVVQRSISQTIPGTVHTTFQNSFPKERKHA